MLRSTISLGLSAGVLGGLLIAPPAQAADSHIDEAIDALPGIVEQMQQRTGVPGIAVAVVHNDKVVYSHGFGVRSVTTKEPVTPDTVFQLASVSKPLGAAVVAAAVGKGKLKWEDPVRKFLPDFKLSDRYVTRKATVADMYSHRSGLPGLVGNELESYGFSRNTIIKRLRYAPLSPFRISYSYSNFGLTTGGEAAAEAAGTTWEKLADKMIFNPLGMKHTSYRHKDYVARKNRATLHQQSGSGTWITSEREPDAQAPAGGASSTVLDMAKWLRMELATGKFDGKRVVKAGPLREARSLQIRTSAAADDATKVSGYALGIDTGTDATGRVRWTHSGAFSAGAATRIMMIPDLDLGLVVLTNGWPIGVPEAIVESFADVAETGAVTKDWLAVFKPAFAPFTTPNRTVNGKPRPANPKPAAALSRYVGSYRNDYTGTAKVSTQGKRLVLHLGPEKHGLVLPLRHWSGDVFSYRAVNSQHSVMPPGFISGVTFDLKRGTLQLEESEGDLGLLNRVG